MDSVSDHSTGGYEREFILADVSWMPLPELLGSNDSVLANAVRRIVDEQHRRPDNVAAFGNYAQ